MRWEVFFDSGKEETEVKICASEYNEEVEQIVKALKEIQYSKSKFSGEKDEKIYFLKKEEIDAVFSQNGKIYLKSQGQNFSSKYRLYELEEKLGSSFVRISKSTLVNINEITSMEMEFNGKMKLYLKNGEVEYTSRNYLKQIKQALGIGGNGYE